MVVFERDASFEARAQGYGLTMQQGSLALRELGLAATVVAEDTPSSSHYVFTSSGHIIGCFGRIFAPLFCPARNAKKKKKRIKKRKKEKEEQLQ